MIDSVSPLENGQIIRVAVTIAHISMRAGHVGLPQP